ncbi:unnamed protein product, partial [Rotaria socialis]
DSNFLEHTKLEPTIGYSYSSGSACACPGYSTTYNGTTPFANCAIFGTAVGGISATGATTCCNYCCTPPSGAFGAISLIFLIFVLCAISLIKLHQFFMLFMLFLSIEVACTYLPT